MKFTDKRARDIAVAESSLEVLRQQVGKVPYSELGPQIEAAERQIIEARERPVHTYECAHCKNKSGKPKQFQSAARVVKVIIAVLVHDEEGNVIERLDADPRNPFYEIICPDCHGELDTVGYLTNRWKDN